MATYKLIQDIEAEDHILGPLTLRQFIFAMIAAFCFYMCFIAFAKHVTFLLAFFLPPGLFCAFFAFPWGGDQPTETWALAKLRFWFKPRRRIWNQSGIKELVTITAPKKVERVLTDQLSQSEVKSRLQALANTIDSRGWAIKHINAVGFMPQGTDSERLIDIPVVPPLGGPDDVAPADDIMDADHNPLAQQFDSMINKSAQDYRQRLMEQLKQPQQAGGTDTGAQGAAAAQQWFVNHNPVPAATGGAAGRTPASPSADDTAALIHGASPEEYGHLRTLKPIPAAPVDDQAATPVTVNGDPAILSLSKNNDWNVATLAREAQRAKGGGEQDEVVISLH